MLKFEYPKQFHAKHNKHKLHFHCYKDLKWFDS
jgi:hypothetical protein